MCQLNVAVGQQNLFVQRFCPAKMQFKFGKYQIYNEPFLGKIFWCLYEMKKKNKQRPYIFMMLLWIGYR